MAPAAADELLTNPRYPRNLLSRSDAFNNPLTNPLTSPTLSQLSKRDASTPSHTYHPGQGTLPPEAFNNKGLFGLFALLAAAMVLASIWFFFWAKNGGFVWHKSDWDDYKTTVLRRKGKDGKTLSNATPATNLGEKSIAGTWDIERDARDRVDARDFGADRANRGGKKTRPHGHRERAPSDEDLRAYRKERPARVGGLNKQEDGSTFDPSNASRSDLASESSRRPLTKKYDPPMSSPPKRKGFMEKKREKAAGKKEEKKMQKEEKEREQRRQAGRKASRPRHVFAADEASTVADPSETNDADNYFSAYRPPAPPHAPSRRNEQRQSSRQHGQRHSASNSRQPSPTKPGVRPEIYAGSEAGTSDTGTKVYTHHLPGLSGASRDTGFRRGNYGPRRGSLSDSDDNDDLAGFRRR